MSSTNLGSDEAYADAMHSILSSEPCRGLITEPTRLLPHVFIGSQSNAEDLTAMRRLGISHVLNCAGYKGTRPSPNASPYDGLGIEYYEFKAYNDRQCLNKVYMIPHASLHKMVHDGAVQKAEDSDRYDITRHFGEAFRFLNAAKRDGGTVLVHCALGINRSAAVCVAYMMVERRLPLLAVTRIIKDRRRIVLANKSFQRQLVGFARNRGLLGEFPVDDEAKDGSDDDDRLSGAVRRLALNDRASNGVDWKLNGLRVDLGGSSHRSGTSAPYKPRSAAADDRRLSHDNAGGPKPHRAFNSAASSRHDYFGADFTPTWKWVSRGVPTRSRETGDVMITPSYASPRQYRATKSTTSLIPTTRYTGSAPAYPNSHSHSHGRSSSASRFSLGFL